MAFKIKKITNLIASFLEFECRKIKLVKWVIAILLSALLLEFTTWQDTFWQGLLIAMCVVDFKKCLSVEEKINL